MPTTSHHRAVFAEALRHQQAERLDQAVRLYRQIPADDACHPDSLHMLGLIATQSEHHDEAIALLSQALKHKPHWAQLHNSLGLALARAGRGEEACRAYRQAVDLKPDYAGAYNNFAAALKTCGQFDDALRAYRRLLDLVPDSADTHNQVGVTLAALDRPEEALAAYRQALALKPDFAEAHFNVGLASHELGRHQEALNAYQQCISLKPRYVNAYLNLGVTLKALGRHEDMLAAYRRAIEIDPAYAQAHNNLCVALQEMGRLEEAVAAGRRAIGLKPDYAEAHSNLGIALGDLGRMAEAESAFRRALELKPDYAYAYNNLGVVLKECGRLEASADACRRAIELRPDYVGAYNNLGTTLKELGRNEEALSLYSRAAQFESPGFDSPLVNQALLLLELGRQEEARQACGQALAINANSGAAWHMHSELKRFRAGDTDIGRMEALLATARTRGLRLEDRINLEFALGKAWMDIGDPERAFIHLNEANRCKRSTITYDAEATARWHARIAQTMTPELLGRLGNAGDPSEIPVFIIGMPRSGTSLVEQILASHPDIHGAGELWTLQQLADGLPMTRPGEPARPNSPDEPSPQEQLQRLGRAYLEQILPLAPRHRRIVDKMPTNFPLAGLIHLILPNARIIHCRRDPVDTCLSCYSKNFRSGLKFSFDQRELGLFYRSYETLMEHWRNVLPPGRFTEVVYEDLVDDLEPQSRRLIAFCGMDWNDACLDFHRTDRQVRTVSAAQVRQPLYRSSIGRWRPYASQLSALLDTLGIAAAAS